MTLLRAAALTLSLATAALSQEVVERAAIADLLRHLDAQPEDRPLLCHVTPTPAHLDLGFRFQAGYLLSVPLSQYSDLGHRWTIVMEVAPQDGEPVYLVSRLNLPALLKGSAKDFGGAFLMGEGHYRVKWMLLDDLGRSCRGEWGVDAQLQPAERNVALTIPPDTVSDFARHGLSPPRAGVGKSPLRLTILLEAAPMSMRRTTVDDSDSLALLGLLSSLLGQAPASSVRLVVFSLDYQKELYRQDDFKLAALDQVKQSLESFELKGVDYRTLQNPAGQVELLAHMTRRELEEPIPSDAVIFLGPPARDWEKLPPNFPAHFKGVGAPRFFYLQYRAYSPQAVPHKRDSGWKDSDISHTRLGPPQGDAVTGDWPDAIYQVVARLKGETFVAYTPGDFSRAVDQLEKETASKKRP